MIRLGGRAMSKSRGNVVSPDEYFAAVGADALRLYHLFVGPPVDDIDWTDQTDEIIDGCSRFLAACGGSPPDRLRRQAIRATSSWTLLSSAGRSTGRSPGLVPTSSGTGSTRRWRH